MSIESTYKAFILAQILKEKIEEGEIISYTDIEDEFQDRIESLDLTKPQFVASDYYVVKGENASAAKLTSTFTAIMQDLSVLYTEIQNMSNLTINNYERWKQESESLEKRIIDIEDETENLLLGIQDTEGYFSFIVDNFSDLSLVDQDNSTAKVDTIGQVVTLGEGTEPSERIFLNSLNSQNVSFRVRANNSFIGQVDGTNTSLVNIFKQTSDIWWTRIETKKAEPVTCELTVEISSTPIEFSRIVIELHDSVQSRPINITPLYSVDNHNFFQLPTINYTQEARSNVVFTFEKIEATNIKFLLTKEGPDPGITDRITYQFGFKSIAFYKDSFSDEDSQVVVSKPLFILNGAKEIVPFSKVSLEVCERLEANTNIRYFVSVSNDEDFPILPSTIWYEISNFKRSDLLHPSSINFADIEEVTFGITETIGPSYDGRNIDPSFINPQGSFNLLSNDNGTILDENITTTTYPRYFFINENERILNYQIKDRDYTGSGTGTNIEFDIPSLTLFRNVGEKGLDPNNPDNQVRSIQKGWRFEDPYYITTIEIQNVSGMEIDVGDRFIIIDDVKYTNKISNSVLSGKTSTQSGVHIVKIHKDNWVYVQPELNTLADLKAADTLYPYNHKLLIEGYKYGTTYPVGEERVYNGADIFAAYKMLKAPIFQLTTNIGATEYQYFATDRDIPNSHDSGNLSTMVFVVKVDDKNSDFINESFMLRFKLVNQSFNYLRFKAELSTENIKATPVLDSYKIKVA